MNKARLLIEEMTFVITAFAIIYMLLIIPAYMIIPSSVTVLGLLAMLLPFIALHFVRSYVRILPLFLLLHILPPLIAFLICPTLLQKLVFGGLLTVCTVFSIINRLTGEKMSLSLSVVAFTGIASVALSVGAARMGYAVLAPVFPIGIFVVILCWVVQSNLVNLDFSLSLITRTTVQPVKHILATNNKLLVIVVVILLCAAVISPFLAIDRIVNLLLYGLFLLLRFLLSFLSGETTEAPPPESAPPAGDTEIDYLMSLPQKDPFLLWVILEKIIEIVVYVGLIVGSIALVAWALYTFYKRFNTAKAPDTDVTENISAELINPTSLFKGLFNLPFLSLPENKVRRQFVKKIKRHKQRGIDIQHSDTPDEIREKIAAAEDIAELTDAYNKVRYNDQ